MNKWFQKQSRLVQVILLLIPGVNWVVEICVRWSSYLAKKSTIGLVAALLVTVFGLVIGWIDIVWCLLFKKLIFTK